MATAASQRRKITKPLMEKRRRARINSCLTQLQDFLTSGKSGAVVASEQDEGRRSRLEKADILEMTVKYLHLAKSQYPSDITHNDKEFVPGCLSRYLEGYHQCMLQVAEFSSNQDRLDEKLRSRLLDHLCQAAQRTSKMSEQSLPEQRQTTDIWRPW